MYNFWSEELSEFLYVVFRDWGVKEIFILNLRVWGVEEIFMYNF